MQLVVTFHGFSCDFTHFPTSSYEPFNVLAYVTNNKAWSRDVGENVYKNALEMVKVNHRPYLLSIVKIGHSRTCFQKHFEHELEFLRVCLDSININPNLCDLDSKFLNYAFNGLQFPK
jgi:hypothetical protein